MDVTLSWVDLALAALLLISIGLGLWRGLAFEVMSLAGWVVAYFAAGPLAPVVEGLLPEGRFGPAALHVVALALAFFAVLVVWSLATRLVKALIHATPLSVVDRLGGAGFGALRGVLIALALVLVIGASPLARSATWQASRAAPVLAGVLHDAAPLLPEPLSHFISRSMTPSDAASTD
ncbi:CvpA family protein [Roseateles saccharophilus]|uniref:Membrane protein required for colicin V production n=1 Tax=Roseateles saccharophilus TaxID=304 RepID=A0A4R3VLE5_ROSSA|nr:CvpA family protein [Roseateles saccharophilus]MDG0832474.1 CvpA family protein [Roseateles saccharophilus]TCV03935.1 membrane protein required for colicin V production [Roseateles saccharophilus]